MVDYNFALSFQSSLSRFKRRHGRHLDISLYLSPYDYAKVVDENSPACKSGEDIGYIHGEYFYELQHSPYVEEGHIVLIAEHLGVTEKYKLKEFTNNV